MDVGKAIGGELGSEEDGPTQSLFDPDQKKESRKFGCCGD